MGRVYFSKGTLGKVNYCKNQGFSFICILQRAFPAVEVAMVFAVFFSLFREPASNKMGKGGVAKSSSKVQTWGIFDSKILK